MRTRDEMVALAEGAVKRALSMDAASADVFVHQTRVTRIGAFGRFVHPSVSMEEGFGVRVVVDGRLGISGASSLSGIDDAMRDAIESARNSPRLSHAFTFPAPSARLDPLPLHPRLERPDLDRLSATAEEAAHRLLEAGDVDYAEASVTSTWREVAIANSEGSTAYDRSASERIGAEARVTRGGTSRSARDAWVASVPIAETLDLDAFTDDIAGRARSAIDSQPLQGSVDQVVLAPAPVAQLLGIFTNALSGRVAASGQSPLRDRIGERVVDERVTLRDLPHGPLGFGHRVVDDEGTPTANATFVEQGMLRMLLYDAQTAAGAGRAPTGHATRAGSHGGVSLGPLNLALDAGDESLQELIEQTERGILVNQAMMGAFTSNQMTGDFSLAIPFAFLIEGGRIRHALPPTTIGGNVHKVLADVRGLGRERRTYQPGTAPALRAGGVSCAT